MQLPVFLFMLREAKGVQASVATMLNSSAEAKYPIPLLYLYRKFCNNEELADSLFIGNDSVARAGFFSKCI